MHALKGNPLELHNYWMYRVFKDITHSAQTVPMSSSPITCPLGEWMTNIGSKEYSKFGEYDILQEEHRKLYVIYSAATADRGTSRISEHAVSVPWIKEFLKQHTRVVESLNTLDRVVYEYQSNRWWNLIL